MKNEIYDQLQEVIDNLDSSKKELIFLLSEFQELISCLPEDEKDLSLLFDFLSHRPDLLLNQIQLLSKAGLIKSVKKIDDDRKLEVISYINAGFGKNWDGSGCDARKTISNVEQTMILSTDAHPRYSNRHNVELKISELPGWTPNIVF